MAKCITTCQHHQPVLVLFSWSGLHISTPSTKRVGGAIWCEGRCSRSCNIDHLTQTTAAWKKEEQQKSTIRTFLIAIIANFMIRFYSDSQLKGSSDAKHTLHICLIINVLEVCTHFYIYNDKNPSSVFFFFKSPFSNQAVLRFLSEWGVQAPPTIVDWQGRLTLDLPWVSWELSTIESTSVQGKTRCLWLSDWGVLLLDVIMNIAVVI